MSDNATLVERLREAAQWISDGVGLVPGPEVCDEAAARIAELEAERDKLMTALTGMVDMYVEMVDSGDAGYWDAEKVPQVLAARAALSTTPSGE